MFLSTGSKVGITHSRTAYSCRFSLRQLLLWCLIVSIPMALLSALGARYRQYCAAIAPFEKVCGARLRSSGDGTEAFLNGPRAIRRLDLSGLNRQLDDDVLMSLREDLQRLPALTVLDLSESAITDVGLQELSHLHGIKYLSLDKTSVTDRGLRYLYSMRALRVVSLNGTQVTDSGAKSLKHILPACRVAR